MPRPTRIEFPGALNYVSIHSHSGARVFQDDIDRSRFLQILDFAVARYELNILAYALLEDGYRLLFQTLLGNMTRTVQYINSHYMAYINTRRGKTGRLFAGRYKSVIIEQGDNALKVCRYIHLLPVRAGLVAHPEDYKWTSHYRYATGNGGAPKLSIKPIMGQFETVQDQMGLEFHKYVLSGLTDDRDSMEKLLKKKRVIGSPEYEQKVMKGDVGEKPVTVSPETVIEETAGYLSVSPESIMNNKTKPNFPRNVAIYLCRNKTGAPLEELGALFGVGPSSICNTAKRVEAHRSYDKELESSIRNLEEKLQEIRRNSEAEKDNGPGHVGFQY